MSEPYDPNSWGSTDPGYQGRAYPSPPQTTANHSQPNQIQPYPAQPYPAQPYPAQPYPAQPYSDQTYPAQPYPALSYPAQSYPAQSYPAPMYSIYPYPGGIGGGRPGQVVAAAVLSYIEAGFLILTGLILFSGSSAVSDWSSSNNSDDYGWGMQFGFAGLGDLLAAGLLIAGGVMFSGRNRRGRTLGAAGLIVCVIEAIFWISWLDGSSGAIIPWATIYLVMPVIATSMSFAGSVRRWLDNVEG